MAKLAFCESCGQELFTNTFEEDVIRAANLGDDSDTVAAVCGALAGADYGYSAIPPRWIAGLKNERMIREIALALVRNAEGNAG